MKTYVGDIWALIQDGYSIVVPVNLGWKGTGENVMGRGLAKEAVRLYGHEDTARWLGKIQREVYSVFKEFKHDPNDPAHVKLWIYHHDRHPLIFMPSKPLNKEAPWFSWKNKADLKMIDGGLKAFPDFLLENKVKKAAMPLLGAGNGGLDPVEIRSLIIKRLGNDDRVALVLPKELGKEQGWRT